MFGLKFFQVGRRFMSSVLAAALLLGPEVSYAQSLFPAILPEPGSMVALSQAYNPPVLRGIKVFADDPLKFDFILDPGDQGKSSMTNGKIDPKAQAELKEISSRLIKYFLTTVTVPEEDVWVNLSPYEKDRITAEKFGQTEMGRDLLSQDYLLKQITASLMSPEGEAGKKFWSRVYEEVQKKFGSTEIPTDTFNKVWIMPEKAVVYEKSAEAGAGQSQATAFVVESKLKVMLESDYAAREGSKAAGLVASSQSVTATQELSKAIARDVIIPLLQKEVNEGANFAPLRQVYNSIILALWYKAKVQGSIMAAYADHNKVDGVDITDKAATQKIWQQYVEAFKKGAVNLVKEEKDPMTGDVMPRRYFAGGFSLGTKENAQSVIEKVSVLPKRFMAGAVLAGYLLVSAGCGSGGEHASAPLTLEQVTAQVDSNLKSLSGTPSSTWIAQQPGYIATKNLGERASDELMVFAQNVNENTDSRKWALRLLGEVGTSTKVYEFLISVVNSNNGIWQWWHKDEATNALNMLHNRFPTAFKQVLEPVLPNYSTATSDQAMSVTDTLKAVSAYFKKATWAAVPYASKAVAAGALFVVLGIVPGCGSGSGSSTQVAPILTAEQVKTLVDNNLRAFNGASYYSGYPTFRSEYQAIVQAGAQTTDELMAFAMDTKEDKSARELAWNLLGVVGSYKKVFDFLLPIMMSNPYLPEGLVSFEWSMARNSWITLLAHQPNAYDLIVDIVKQYKNGTVVIYAIAALPRINDARILPYLNTLLSDPSLDWEVTRYAIDALRDTRDLRAIPILEMVVKTNKDYDIVHWSIDIIAYIKTQNGLKADQAMSVTDTLKAVSAYFKKATWAAVPYASKAIAGGALFIALGVVPGCGGGGGSSSAPSSSYVNPADLTKDQIQSSVTNNLMAMKTVQSPVDAKNNVNYKNVLSLGAYATPALIAYAEQQKGTEYLDAVKWAIRLLGDSGGPYDYVYNYLSMISTSNAWNYWQQLEAQRALADLIARKPQPVTLNSTKAYQWLSSSMGPLDLVTTFPDLGVDKQDHDVSWIFSDGQAIAAFILANDLSRAERVARALLKIKGDAQPAWNNAYIASTGKVAVGTEHEGLWVGPNVVAARALLKLYQVTGDQDLKNKILMAMPGFVLWLQGSFVDKGDLGYLKGGKQGAAKIDWTSTEHNLRAMAFLDLYAKVLGGLGRSEETRVVRTMADKIASWVETQMWSNGYYFPGYVAGETPDIAVGQGVDVQLLVAIMASEGGRLSQFPHAKDAVEYVLKNMQLVYWQGQGFQGIPRVDGNNSIWAEGTGYLVSAMTVLGYANEQIYPYRDTLARLQQANGGIMSAIGDPKQGWPDYWPYAGVEALTAVVAEQPLSGNQMMMKQLPADSTDKAQDGGIDLRKSTTPLEMQNNSAAIKFNIDPRMIERIQSSNGFRPEVYLIVPLPSLPLFLGMSQDQVQQVVS
ncbi:MAG: HEAT repeat domain-containing protein [Candidatus Omnitrophica bacterium]|nr:HEAT repeat domain-containing protein [Candidatus Omnitrophota bacterium]